MRKLLVVVLFFACIISAKSQNLTVEGAAPDLYVTHIVAPKENFYSIGRLYNQAPKSIAAFNKIEMEKGLTIGQHIKIPLDAQNLSGGEASEGAGNSIPLTHIVAKSETLFKIAQDNKVSAQQLRKWNNLSSDQIVPGSALVIGYLKMNGTATSAMNNSTGSANNSMAATSKTENAAEPRQTGTETKKDEPFASVNEAGSPANNEKSSKSKSQEEGNTLGNDMSQISADSSPSDMKKDTALSIVSEETKQLENAAGEVVKEEPEKKPKGSLAEKEENKKSELPINSKANSSDGFFASLFDASSSQKSLNTKSGQAATFKSTSGWQDKKYYVLISDVTPGTILKISSAENKVVYAKVLGSMPEMKENDGLLLRISNAAASYLGIIDPKFPVQISYYQ